MNRAVVTLLIPAQIFSSFASLAFQLPSQWTFPPEPSRRRLVVAQSPGGASRTHNLPASPGPNVSILGSQLTQELLLFLRKEVVWWWRFSVDSDSSSHSSLVCRWCNHALCTWAQTIPRLWEKQSLAGEEFPIAASNCLSASHHIMQGFEEPYRLTAEDLTASP